MLCCHRWAPRTARSLAPARRPRVGRCRSRPARFITHPAEFCVIYTPQEEPCWQGRCKKVRNILKNNNRKKTLKVKKGNRDLSFLPHPSPPRPWLCTPMATTSGSCLKAGARAVTDSSSRAPFWALAELGHSKAFAGHRGVPSPKRCLAVNAGLGIHSYLSLSLRMLRKKSYF